MNESLPKNRYVPKKTVFPVSHKLSKADMKTLDELAELWACTKNEALRTAIRLTSAITKR